MKLQLGTSWEMKLKRQVERYQFDVGVLEDKPHRDPVEHNILGDPSLGTYAGGPIRKATRQAGPLTTGEILVKNMERLNINILSRPFEEKNSDIMRFTKAFLQLAVSSKNISIKRVENLLQAVVRNPILKQEYGKNKSVTADAKGFDRHLMDTGQMFKAIIARAKRV